MSILSNEKLKAHRVALIKDGSCLLTRRIKAIPFRLAKPRLVNSFSLGCDPEFLLLKNAQVSPFHTPSWTPVAASDCGLRVDEAFGCDGARVPVELRAHPSRFAIEVVASLLNSLRWMYLHNASARSCERWAAGSYLNGFALGGHVHVGRKTSSTEREVRALNVVCKALELSGCFLGNRERRENTHYGRFSDWRTQAWGYEYRSFGCFLFSPSIAHLLLTLSKIAVLDQEICALLDTANKTSKVSSVKLAIHQVLKFYAPLDDDAAIAFRGVLSSPTNMRIAWGLGTPSDFRFNTLNLTMPYVPATIAPDPLSLKEVVQAILTGTPPPFRVPEQTWRVIENPPPPPLPVFQIQPSDESYIGERELLAGLYAVNGSNFDLRGSRGEMSEKEIVVSFDLVSLLRESEYKRLREVCTSLRAEFAVKAPRVSRLEVSLSRALRQGAALQAFKRFFGSGVLPIADKEHLSAEWCERWKRRLRAFGIV